MARKPNPDAPDNTALKDHIRDSAKHIWLAGLRAFAKAMHRLGWPSADDLTALHARFAALEQALAHGKPTTAASPAKPRLCPRSLNATGRWRAPNAQPIQNTILFYTNIAYA